MKVVSSIVLTLLCSTTAAQQYDNYPEYQDFAGDYGAQDTLYQDYAARHEQKQVGGGWVELRFLQAMKHWECVV